MTYWVFLFVKTKFPMIRPKASGLQKQDTVVKQRQKTSVSQITPQTVSIELRLVYPLTACTRPVITLSTQRCGTSSRSFRQTLCHTMSVRVHADSRGAITPRTRPVHRKIKTMLYRHYRGKIFQCCSWQHSQYCQRMHFNTDAQNSPLWPWMHTLPSAWARKVKEQSIPSVSKSWENRKEKENVMSQF